MSTPVRILIGLGVRLVVFGVVFFIATRRNPKVQIRSKWMTPLIAAVFAVLNTGLYWALTPILNIATFGAINIVMPFVVNTILLVATVRVFKAIRRDPEAPPWLAIEGIFATLWMAIFLTLAHGVAWLAVDYLPTKI
jgi:hypothetical protein